MHFRNRSRSSSRLTAMLGWAALLGLTGWACSPSDSTPDEPAPDQAGEKAAPAAYAKDSVIVRFRGAGSATTLRRTSALVRGTVKDANDDGVDDRFTHIANGQIAVIRLDGQRDV